ncbi:MAG: ATP-binding protein [Lachnospiraceae bacterium]|nr:ATP-binding protein [Lachnospiraceae bacterium]
MNNNEQNSTEYIRSKMKQFKLVDMREQFQELIEEARATNWDYEEFLVRLLKAEEEGKRARRQDRLTAQAHFEAEKHLEDIDYSFNLSLDKGKIDELSSLKFMASNENILIIGPPGVGKSMVATGIGMKACSAGEKVLFTNAKELLDRLCLEAAGGSLRAALEAMDKVRLLIIDELSYIT